MRMVPVCWLLLSSLLFFGARPVGGAASGGIQPGRETPISLEKERVTISAEKIAVEYELLNPTGQEITTENSGFTGRGRPSRSFTGEATFTRISLAISLAMVRALP
jgi:hypothetical protein